MPAVVAHFHFGQRVLPYLDHKIRSVIKSNVQLFGLGLQGPDLLFHSNVFKPDDTALLGYKIHQNSASDFFGALLSSDCLNYSKAVAYVLGACCHYYLDVVCHPYIEQANDGSYRHHNNLESDLDLAIIRRNGMNKNRNIYLPRAVDYNTVASVYNLSGKNIKTCLDNFHLNTRLLSNPELVKFVESKIGKSGKWSAFSMKKELLYPHETADLLSLLDKAIQPTAKKLEGLYQIILEKEPLPEGYEMNFNGESVL